MKNILKLSRLITTIFLLVMMALLIYAQDVDSTVKGAIVAGFAVMLGVMYKTNDQPGESQ